MGDDGTTVVGAGGVRLFTKKGRVPRPGTEIASGVGVGLQESSAPVEGIDSVSAGTGGTAEERGKAGARPGKE